MKNDQKKGKPNPWKIRKYIAIAVIALVLIGCGVWKFARPAEKAPAGKAPAENPIVTMEMENGGVIVMELYPGYAPNTVANFVSLASSGFYDGLTFHRVIPGFMIQGGDPDGNGAGGPGYAIKGEFAANGVNNPVKHERGVLSMARARANDSARSQFFIMHAAAPHLDGQYAAFGKVISGMEVVDEIAAAPTGANDRPLAEQKIKSVTVDTKGCEYTVQKIAK